MTIPATETTARPRSPASFAGNRRMHVGIWVRNLEKSVAFYRTLFGVEPVKVRPGYAKFEPAEPSVNFTLNERTGDIPTAVSHFGIQVKEPADVVAAAARYQAAGLQVRTEEKTTCCYAVQDKAWVVDPDGNPWEVFVVTEADAPVHSAKATACCPAAEAAR